MKTNIIEIIIICVYSVGLFIAGYFKGISYYKQKIRKMITPSTTEGDSVTKDDPKQTDVLRGGE